MELSSDLLLAARACINGAAAIRETKTIISQTKNNNPKDFVTNADLASEKAILETIRKFDPQTPIFSEETAHADTNSQFRLWTVDPLDGTTNFANHIPLWGIAITLCHENFPHISAIAAPSFDRLYLGDQTCSIRIDNLSQVLQDNDLEDLILNPQEHTLLKAKPPETPNRLTIYTDNGYDHKITSRNLAYLTRISPAPWVNAFGSAVLAPCFAIESNALYFHTGLKPYDNGSWPIAQGAGLVVRDFTGQTPDVFSQAAIVGHEQTVTNFLSQINSPRP